MVQCVYSSINSFCGKETTVFIVQIGLNSIGNLEIQALNLWILTEHFGFIYILSNSNWSFKLLGRARFSYHKIKKIIVKFRNIIYIFRPDFCKNSADYGWIRKKHVFKFLILWNNMFQAVITTEQFLHHEFDI